MPKTLRTLVVLPMVALFAALTSTPTPAQVRAGYEVPFSAESPHPYPTGTGSTPAWSLEVKHPDATYIAIHFDRFDLAPGDRLVIRSPSGRQRHVLTERGRHNLGTFWAPHIKGDTAVLELMSPGRNQGGWGVSIDRYAAGVVEVGDETASGTEAVCGVDDRANALCFQSSEPEIYDRSRAVARLLINGQLLCTGWLVGCEGHLLTNNHCIDNTALSVSPSTAVLNTDYEFMAEAASCGGVGGSGVFWGGVPTLVQREVFLDYAYIQLAGNPQNTYGSFQVENRAPVANERIYIPQHPGGQVKKFAVFSSDATDESGFCEITQPNSGLSCIPGATLGETTYQCDTQGGSSGSPVVAYISQGVIALHHCSLGTDLCPNLGVPMTAILTDLGSNLPLCAVADAVTEVAYGSTTVLDAAFGNGNGALEPVEIVHLVVDLRNDGNYLAGNVSAVLSTSTSGITLLDDQAEWPQIPGFGSRASLSPHFVVQVDAALSCATVIDFDLAISSDQGAFVASFQQTVGSTAGGSGSWSSVDTPLTIPDDHPPGIVSTAPVADTFPIAALTVSVHITHPDVNTLRVDLISPLGTTVRLHDGSSGAAADLITTYDTLTIPDGPGSMADFLGENVNGNWELKVTDQSAGNTGTIQGWQLDAAESTMVVCDPVPCEISAAISATPDTVCLGDSLLLADAGSFGHGEDCSGTLEYQFKLFAAVLQDWSTDPDLLITPSESTSYTVRVRDQITLAEDIFVAPITVVALPVPSPTQSPDPMCLEFPGVTLDAGSGFAGYTWRDDLSQVVGTSQTLALDQTACDRIYSVEVANVGGCSGSTDYPVQCEACTPLEVSPADSPVPVRMDVDGLGTIELELQPDPAVVYHLYNAVDVPSFLAGDWTYKFCDLASGSTGTWTPIDSTTARWTPVIPEIVFEGYWVVVAENLPVTLEGPYGFMTGGAPRPPDSDATASLGNFGCP